MARTPTRLYADTSVFGGVFDEEFSDPSRTLFRQIREGRFQLVLSPLIQDELEVAPQDVRDLLDEVAPHAEVAPISSESLQLQRAYLEAGIVPERCADDALHVAIATVVKCSLIVSWNFVHIVHFDKIPLYNAVNRKKGYPTIAIYSPREVIEYEDENI